MTRSNRWGARRPRLLRADGANLPATITFRLLLVGAALAFLGGVVEVLNSQNPFAADCLVIAAILAVGAYIARTKLRH